jgi:hypothetical protein
MASSKKNNGSSANVSIEPINLPDLNGQIAETAYYKAEIRGFAPGYELEDWLEAERELMYCGNASSSEVASVQYGLQVNS